MNMNLSQTPNLEKYLRPPCFDAEFLDTRVLKEWTHWKKCFEYFLKTLFPSNTTQQYNYNLFYNYNGHTDLYNDQKYHIFINHLSVRVYDHIKNITDYRAAMDTLDKAICSNEPKQNDKTKSFNTSQHDSTNDVAELTKILFQDVKHGKLEALDKIKNLKADKLKKILEARNRRHKTLLQEAIITRREEVVDQLLNVISYVSVEQSSEHKEHKFELIVAAETFINNSNSKLYDFQKNPLSQNRALIGIITYAFNFVTEYKKYMSGKLIDTDVVTVDALLTALEFDEKCTKFATCDQGRGLLYYELATNVKESDIEFIVDLFECNIIAPVKRLADRLSLRRL